MTSFKLVVKSSRGYLRYKITVSYFRVRYYGDHTPVGIQIRVIFSYVKNRIMALLHIN